VQAIVLAAAGLLALLLRPEPRIAAQQLATRSRVTDQPVSGSSARRVGRWPRPRPDCSSRANGSGWRSGTDRILIRADQLLHIGTKSARMTAVARRRPRLTGGGATTPLRPPSMSSPNAAEPRTSAGAELTTPPSPSRTPGSSPPGEHVTPGG
jgi:hypothetical protein